MKPPHRSARHDIGGLITVFKHYADVELPGVSPLYERLARGVAGDGELLALAGQAASKPVPNLLFGAAHYLLLRDPRHELAAFFPSLAVEPRRDADPYPLFRSFCLERAPAIAEIMRTRRVQTNEVRRCAVLLPAFGLAARLVGGRPLALIEVGASAGLNLRWARYGYRYGGAATAGDETSPVQIAVELRGPLMPPIPEPLPPVASLLGIDLQPVDVHDDDAVLWLRALIWPEHGARRALLAAAVAVARQHPIEIRAGDALDLLPAALDEVPGSAVPCVFHSFTLNQLAPENRNRFDSIVAEHGARRDLCCVSIEALAGGTPQLALRHFQAGVRHDRVLASTDGHANWIEWLAPAISEDGSLNG